MSFATGKIKHSPDDTFGYNLHKKDPEGTSHAVQLVQPGFQYAKWIALVSAMDIHQSEGVRDGDLRSFDGMNRLSVGRVAI